MKKLFILPFLTIGILPICHAQMLKKLGKQLEKQADKIVTQKVDQLLDENKNTKSTSIQNNNQTSPFRNLPQLENDYARGRERIFEDNFVNEVIGQMASKWISNGRGNIVEISSYPGKWLQLFNANTYKIKDLIKLPENFTIEFDVLTFSESKHEFRLDFGFDYEKGVGNHYFLANQNPVNITASYWFNRFEFDSREVSPKKHSEVEANMSYFANDIMNVKIKVEGKHMSTYVNDYKILDTEMIDPFTKKYFYFAYNSDDKSAKMYINNFRIDKL